MGWNRCWNIQKGLLGKHFQFSSAVIGSRSHQLGKPSQEESMWDFLGEGGVEDLVSVIGPESFRSSLTKGLIDLSQYWVWQLDCEKINLDETRPCQAATAISYLSFGISLIWIRFCLNKDRLFWSRCLGCSHQHTIHSVWLSAVLGALFLLRKACGELLGGNKEICHLILFMISCVSTCWVLDLVVEISFVCTQANIKPQHEDLRVGRTEPDVTCWLLGSKSRC